LMNQRFEQATIGRCVLLTQQCILRNRPPNTA
jgi:hypothetical protein